MTLSAKQQEIMAIVGNKNHDGSPIDLTQLRYTVSYDATKQAILCSVNHLVKRGLIERKAKITRKGYKVTPLALTPLGEAYIASYKTPLKSVLIEDEHNILLPII